MLFYNSYKIFLPANSFKLFKYHVDYYYYFRSELNIALEIESVYALFVASPVNGSELAHGFFVPHSMHLSRSSKMCT